MEGAFSVERVLALAKARTHAAFDRPERGRIGQLRPVAREGRRQAALKRARNPAGKRLRAQRIKLVDGELDLLLVDVVAQRQGGGRGRAAAAGGSCRLGRGQLVLPQAVERGHFIGQGAQRGDLHIAVVRDLRHLLVVFAEILAVLANLVEALGLEQHAGVGAGQAHNRERTHQRGGDKSVRIVQRQRNLADPPVLISGNKKNVIALA